MPAIKIIIFILLRKKCYVRTMTGQEVGELNAQCEWEKGDPKKEHMRMILSLKTLSREGKETMVKELQPSHIVVTAVF